MREAIENTHRLSRSSRIVIQLYTLLWALDFIEPLFAIIIAYASYSVPDIALSGSTDHLHGTRRGKMSLIA